MQKILDNLLSTSPAAVAVVVVVYMFIRYLREERRDLRDDRKTLLQFFNRIHEEHMAERNQSQLSRDRLVAITERNISATNRNTYTLEVLTGMWPDHPKPKDAE